MSAGFQRIYVITVSESGKLLIQIQETFGDTFFKKVAKIAIVESWVIAKALLDKDEKEFMKDNAVHY